MTQALMWRNSNMAKQLLLNKANGDIAVANQNLKLSKSILISEIELHPEFQKLFNINESLLERISESMKENGFDNSQPVHIWFFEDHKWLVDGFTRYNAAVKAKLKTIPYFEHKFETFEECYRYVLSLQVNRRNLEPSELLRNVEKLMGSDYIQNLPGKKSENIAEMLGTSKATVIKAIAVSKDEEASAKVDAGMSVNKAYNELKGKDKPEKKKKEVLEDDFDDFSESENEGNPAPVMINHSDGKERPKFGPGYEDATDKLLIEKNIQVEAAKKEGKAEGAYLMFIYVLAEVLNGKTPKEIYNNPIFSDFSPSEISNVELPEGYEDLVLQLQE